MTPIAEQLASFACKTTFKSLPDVVVENDKIRLLDAIGLALSASRQSFGPQVMRLAYDEIRGRCAGSTADGRLSPADVGLVLGALIHGQDYDDTHTETLIHPSSCVVSAALSLAQFHGLTGKELIELLAIGYEVIVRVGCGAGPGAQMQARGFHGTSIAGACAAAVMYARATSCDPVRVRNALAIAAGLAAGLRESVIDGSFAKVIQPGWAVKTGFWAARAADLGITGPIFIFEGQRGLYASHAGLERCEINRSTHGLGTRWEHIKTDFKLYPVCHHLQAPTEAALSLRAEVGEGNADGIREIRVDLSEQQVEAVCEPRARRLAPPSVYAARFSLPVIVAVALAYGSVGEMEIAKGLQDEAVLDLADRVVHRGVPNPEFPAVMPIEMVVTMADGSKLSRSYASAPGTYGRPIAVDEIEAKFRANARGSLDQPTADQVIEAVRGLESQKDAGPLARSVIDRCAEGRIGEE